MWLQRQLFDLAYSINLLGNEGTTFTGGAEKAVKWKAEMEAYKAEATALLKDYPQLVQSLDKFWNPPRRGGPPPAAAAAASSSCGSCCRSTVLRLRPREAAVRRARRNRT